ncbi:MAG TPA: dihydroorotate dehydrogenase electron transfer subunit [Oscillospiraceae bacterium]|nr:dihydroorotate dehydrogenase electron transfer subunit [Oscillospiraceae bacterium]
MGKYFQDSYRIMQIKQIANGVYDMTVFCPEVASIAKPGQFVHIKIEGFTLRRPMSICTINKENGTIRIVFEIRGQGTEKLATLRVYDYLDMIAPLGNGFDLLDKETLPVIIGGGLGTPPMLALAEYYGDSATAILGFRSQDKAMLGIDFSKTGAYSYLCTDDGSLGRKGYVTDLLAERLTGGHADIVYACGPKAMLKAVAEMSKKFGVRCQVSLEERMGCGVGACLVCACKTQDANGEHFSHVCKDGPVFEANKIVFD